VNYCKLVLEQSHTREDYKELISLCLIFLGGADPTSFLLSTWSISSGTMDGQSNLHSEVALIPNPTPVHFDKQREKQCGGASPFHEPM